MERWQRVQKPPARRGCDYPSFSSTLLDSIYRSIDDEADRGAPDPCPQRAQTRKKQAPEWAPPALPKLKPPREKQPPAMRRRQHLHSATSSSSDCSSYGGFSSSEPDSAPAHPNRLRPIRTGSVPARSNNIPPPIKIPIPPPPEKKQKQKNLNSIRSKFRDLKKSRSPASPAAKLASFLNSLFTSTGGTGRKQQKAADARGGQESSCSTASSYSRSCLAKTPSTADHGVKRSVRFALPVDGGRRETMGKGMGMRWRDFGAEDDDAASDSSSDLFELEDLTAVGRYRDELPVYETTHLGGLIL